MIGFYQGILGGDQITGVLAGRSNVILGYSLRRLRSDYAGPAVRIRRSSDNQLADIGFTSAGAFDLTAYNAFVGTGTGHVVTIYDQGTGGRHATQATASRQGTFDAATLSIRIAQGQFYSIPSTASFLFSAISVYATQTINADSMLLGHSTINVQVRRGISGQNCYSVYDGTQPTGTADSLLSNVRAKAFSAKSLDESIFGGGRMDFFEDGVSRGGGVHGSVKFDLLGSLLSSNGLYNGNLYELLVFDTAHTTTTRQQIETHMLS